MITKIVRKQFDPDNMYYSTCYKQNKHTIWKIVSEVGRRDRHEYEMFW